MQQTNQWFVVYLQGPELRISRWNSQGRPRAGAKHLCGQTCLHKLVDEVMARTLTGRGQPAAEEPAIEQKLPVAATVRTDASLTSTAAYAAPSRPATRIFETKFDEAEPDELEFSTRPVAASKAVPHMVEAKVDEYEPDEFESSARLIPSPKSALIPDPEPVVEAPGYNPRSFRAEAWKREREREQRAARHAGSPHRRSA